MTGTVRYRVDEAVATIMLDRPEARNALIAEAKTELLAALGTAAKDDSVRAVVLTGSGRGFCAGQDLREHAALLESGQEATATVRHHYNPIIEAITTMPKPVVAAVNGVAAGAGAAIAFACDLRLAANSASFVLAFTAVGLGADSGASWTLPRLVGTGRAVELLLLAEPVTAQRALELGLVRAVVPDTDLLDSATELASRLANGPTVAYAAVKQAVAFAAVHDLAAALDKEAELQTMVGRTDDHRGATAAFLAKQRPTFQGR